MNDMELAEEIERHISYRPSGFVIPPYQLYEADAKQIIAALRRGPERPPSGEMVRHHVIQAAYRPRPMCRDCADRDGTCYDGTKCDPFEAALDLLREAAAEAEGRKG